MDGIVPPIESWQVEINALLELAKAERWEEAVPRIVSLAESLPADMARWQQQLAGEPTDAAVLMSLLNVQSSLDELLQMAVAERAELQHLILQVRQRDRLADAYGE